MSIHHHHRGYLWEVTKPTCWTMGALDPLTMVLANERGLAFRALLPSHEMAAPISTCVSHSNWAPFASSTRFNTLELFKPLVVPTERHSTASHEETELTTRDLLDHVRHVPVEFTVCALARFLRSVSIAFRISHRALWLSLLHVRRAKEAISILQGPWITEVSSDWDRFPWHFSQSCQGSWDQFPWQCH